MPVKSAEVGIPEFRKTRFLETTVMDGGHGGGFAQEDRWAADCQVDAGGNPTVAANIERIPGILVADRQLVGHEGERPFVAAHEQVCAEEPVGLAMPQECIVRGFRSRRVDRFQAPAKPRPDVYRKPGSSSIALDRAGVYTFALSHFAITSGGP